MTTPTRGDILERCPGLEDDFHIHLEQAKAHAVRAEEIAAKSAQETKRFIVWLRESSPCEGWVSHEVTASSEAEVREKFRGVRNEWTMEIEAA
jgi:hypothetical protein